MNFYHSIQIPAGVYLKFYTYCSLRLDVSDGF